MLVYFKTRKNNSEKSVVMSIFDKDVFVECMIVRKKSLKDKLFYLALFLVAFVIIFASLYFLPAVGQFGPMIILIAGTVVGLFYLLGMRNLEFEYAVTNGDVTVDKIINKKQRKRLMTFDCKSIEKMGKYDDIDKSALEVKREIFACENEDGKNGVYVVANSKKYGATLLVFDPNDKILNAMKPYVARAAQLEFYKNN